MTAALLREAADRLDALADTHEGREWTWTGVGEHGYPQRVSSLGNAALIADTFNDPDMPHPAAEYIAVMSPAVAKALAAWLREAAESWRLGTEFTDEGLAVARAILGDHQ